MDIYSRKSNYKIILVILALLIGAGTLYYSNILARKIKSNEETQVKLWAEAIANKARLVKYTNELFNNMASDQRSKVSLWTEATKLAVSTEDPATIDFISNLIIDFQDIPVILMDSNNVIIDTRLVELPEWVNNSDSVQKYIDREFSTYSPIEVQYFEGRTQQVYYQDSELFKRLKEALNAIVESFISEVVINSAAVPVILTDETGNYIASGNLDSLKLQDSLYLKDMLRTMSAENQPLEIELGNNEKKYIYYKDSRLLVQMRNFPYIQLGLVAAFLLISYLLFSTLRNAEQNRVWVGLAKETAHQLGTPIQSLIGWVEYLKESLDKDDPSAPMFNEMSNDVKRLELIAERFSKIGSAPKLETISLLDSLNNSVDYMKGRISKKVELIYIKPETDVLVGLSPPLFEWVIENLLKNGLDAMDGTGTLTIEVQEEETQIHIDISDTGKGIPKNRFNTIFEPGYSTKKRGWGLGLTLTKRIVENYHNGKIFVKYSTLNEGTTFRISLPKS